MTIFSQVFNLKQVYLLYYDNLNMSIVSTSHNAKLICIYTFQLIFYLVQRKRMYVLFF